MEDKTKRVELENSTKGIAPQTFEISHAERLLRMPDNGGWKLPEKSTFKFDPKDGLNLITDKGDSSKPA